MFQDKSEAKRDICHKNMLSHVIMKINLIKEKGIKFIQTKKIVFTLYYFLYISEALEEMVHEHMNSNY